MKFDLQPGNIGNKVVFLRPLSINDFELLFEVASDLKIWEQHPTKDRYKREVFLNFFKGAIDSGGAFIIFDANSHEAIGSSRFYNYNESEKSVLIGYTFLAKKYWGTQTNSALKKLMLDYAFQYVEKVIFHVGKVNMRSLKAMEKLGANRVGEEEIAYVGEVNNMNVIFEMTKLQWNKQHNADTPVV
jgi:RimJ/RimL family protein N-acetyltransferase